MAPQIASNLIFKFITWIDFTFEVQRVPIYLIRTCARHQHLQWFLLILCKHIYKRPHLLRLLDINHRLLRQVHRQIIITSFNPLLERILIDFLLHRSLVCSTFFFLLFYLLSLEILSLLYPDHFLEDGFLIVNVHSEVFYFVVTAETADELLVVLVLELNYFGGTFFLYLGMAFELELEGLVVHLDFINLQIWRIVALSGSSASYD